MVRMKFSPGKKLNDKSEPAGTETTILIVSFAKTLGAATAQRTMTSTKAPRFSRRARNMMHNKTERMKCLVDAGDSPANSETTGEEMTKEPSAEPSNLKSPRA